MTTAMDTLTASGWSGHRITTSPPLVDIAREGLPVETDDRVEACHWMLLRLAGWVPDTLLTQGRHWLADGRLTDLAKAVAHAVLTARVRMVDLDLDLLTELCREGGTAIPALQLVEVSPLEHMPLFAFTAQLTTGDEPDTELAERPDPVARAAVDAAEAEPDVRAVWLAWRFPVWGGPWPPPRRVFVVETEEDADLVPLTARLQYALRTAGEVDPQVETYPTRTDPPTYQQLARSGGTLLWARTPDPGIRIATVFDEVDPQSGPAMRPDHIVLDDVERRRVLAYLSRGELLLETLSKMDDVWEPEALAVVPINFRTDGHWIWSDATTYYLDRYGLAPDPLFLEHIRGRRYVFDESGLDGAAIHRALAVLEKPLDEEPAWVVGG
ncbi:hypothetical protein ACWDV4_01465 [Micromonospora sp. NPDC003197]